jgi:hypothetical protein
LRGASFGIPERPARQEYFCNCGAVSAAQVPTS